MQTGNPTDLATEVIPDCVDRTLFYLLYAIDQGMLSLAFTSASGNAVDLTKDGLSELGGWLQGTDGWIETYSKERYNNDFNEEDDFFTNLE